MLSWCEYGTIGILKCGTLTVYDSNKSMNITDVWLHGSWMLNSEILFSFMFMNLRK